MAERADLRREAGQRTRGGLLTATLELLARKGPEGLSLREVTEKAGANVAAVSYHFGSLKALRDAAVETALERYLDAQLEALARLTPDSTLTELAVGFARPMMQALAAGGTELAIIRTVARIGIDPPAGWGRLTGKFEQTRTDALRVLTARLPGIDEQELIFRTRCIAGLLNWLALAPIGAELAAEPAERIEHRLVPILAGALAGQAAPV
ncbi:TetR/AcrR family transcriptional regulator [Paractinoplanes ferrugineus]|uniref:TetR family transcriptional regulator n=1 Tax=Paractinoplanes ferrugineus TaxID=113564 RepID=A0A919J2P1_9ACTN|nr:TetR/AcrR family transcriptional regulator [Actinoplanes ferrugineus]GIE13676.1 TetR family transcriptional regulator [Actinoplanes ferrugineus]